MMEDKALSRIEEAKRQSSDDSPTKTDHKSYQPNSESKYDKNISRDHQKPTETEGKSSITSQGTISSTSSELLDDSGLSILSNSDIEDETQTDNEECKEKPQRIKKTDGSEEEGTYEELVCLVRQFYVEKPINPAALAHQNIETC